LVLDNFAKILIVSYGLSLVIDGLFIYLRIANLLLAIGKAFLIAVGFNWFSGFALASGKVVGRVG
jgi:hypothetical protein